MTTLPLPCTRQKVRGFYLVVYRVLSHVRRIFNEAPNDNLYGSFDRPYVGNAVDGFYEYLKTNNRNFIGHEFHTLDRPYYGKFCSIVQSSGTGKSRLMTEVRFIDCIVVPGG